MLDHRHKGSLFHLFFYYVLRHSWNGISEVVLVVVRILLKFPAKQEVPDCTDPCDEDVRREFLLDQVASSISQPTPSVGLSTDFDFFVIRHLRGGWGGVQKWLRM
jgi:hypothetical protein